MGVLLPKEVAESGSSRYLAAIGWKRIRQGKSRDIYEFPEREDLLLMVATDRVSIFDFVLPAFIPRKGEVSTALTHFWLTDVLKEFPSHLEASRSHNLVAILKKKYPRFPAERCLAVKKVDLLPFELIFRHHLGGSAYEEYAGRMSGTARCLLLPKWTFLKDPMFTPTTKEDSGHDVRITTAEYYTRTGAAGRETAAMCLRAYLRAYRYARSRGILILDTKFEAGDVIADEVLTPDSSRFTTIEDFEEVIREGRDFIFYDKQVIREWGMGVETPWGKGLHLLNPRKPEHVAFVHQQSVSRNFVEETQKRYLEVFSRLTGSTLENYQRERMFI